MDAAIRRAVIAELRARIETLEAGLPAPPPGSIARIADLAAAEFDVPRHLILSEARRADVALARHAVMALAQRCLGYSTPRIGRALRRDHTTVLHGLRRVARLAAADPDFAARLDRLAARITDHIRGTEQ